MASSTRDWIHSLPDQKITLTHLPAQLCTSHFLVLPKYLNNVVEADHGKLRLLIRPVRGFKRSSEGLFVRLR